MSVILRNVCLHIVLTYTYNPEADFLYVQIYYNV